MTSQATVRTSRYSLIQVIAATAFLFGLPMGMVHAQQAPPAKKAQQGKQAPAAPPARPAAAATLTPAARAQLDRDVETCFAGRDLATLERACTNALANQLSVVGLESVSRGHFYFNRSSARINAGDIPSAIEDLKKAIADDFKPHIAYTQLGQLYLNRQADVANAETSYRKALEQDPSYRDARIGLALTLLRKRDAGGKADVSGAVRELNAAIELSPQDPELHYQKGLALAQGTSIDDAMKSLDESLRLRPGYVDALIARAQLRMDRGEGPKAVEDLNTIVASNPGDATMLAGLGLAYLQLKQYDRAVQLCDQALRRDVKHVTAHVCLGYAYTNQGVIQKAEEAFERALQWDDKSVIAYIGRGYMRKRSGNFASSVADFDRALALDRNSIEALLNLISLYTDSGDLDKALRSFDEANNINRKDARAYYLRAFVWALKNDQARAKRDIDTAFGLVGNAESDAYLARGTVSYFLNDAQRALPDLRESVRLNPDNGQAHRFLARTLLKLGNIRDAETSLKRAHQLLPNDWNVMRVWGLLELQRNNFDKAKEQLDRSLELNGGFIEGYVTLGKAYEGLRNPELAKAQYQLALTKLDYDSDGPPAREEAKRRLAALNQPAAAAPPAPVTPPPAKAIPQAAPPTSPVPTAAAPKAEPKVAVAPLPAAQNPAQNPASNPASNPTLSPGSQQPAPPPAAERPQGDSLMCRLLKNFSGHARDYTGLRIETGCGPQ